jgi:hypothetical protein
MNEQLVSVDRAIELRKTQNQDADSPLIGGRQHGCIASNRERATGPA